MPLCSLLSCPGAPSPMPNSRNALLFTRDPALLCCYRYSVHTPIYYSSYYSLLWKCRAPVAPRKALAPTYSPGRFTAVAPAFASFVSSLVRQFSSRAHACTRRVPARTPAFSGTCCQLSPQRGRTSGTSRHFSRLHRKETVPQSNVVLNLRHSWPLRNRIGFVRKKSATTGLQTCTRFSSLCTSHPLTTLRQHQPVHSPPTTSNVPAGSTPELSLPPRSCELHPSTSSYPPGINSTKPPSPTSQTDNLFQSYKIPCPHRY